MSFRVGYRKWKYLSVTSNNWMYHTFSNYLLRMMHPVWHYTDIAHVGAMLQETLMGQYRWYGA